MSISREAKAMLLKQRVTDIAAIRLHALHFIDLIEISDIRSDDVPDYEMGTFPSIPCQCCFNRIAVLGEGEFYWVRDGREEGIDYNDWYLAYLIAAIQAERPQWKFRSSCKYCHEELTFTKPHNCT